MTQHYTITIKDDDGKEISQRVHWDSDIWDWGRVFRSILTWLSFQSVTIDQLIKGEDDE